MSSKSESAQGVTFWFVLNALRQWWKVAAPAGLVLAAAVGALIYLLFEPQYRASAWLRIESVAPYIAFPSREDSRRFVATQVELIRSPLVLGPVVSQPEIARLPEIQQEQSPIEWLSKKIQVRAVGNSELFTVSFAGPDPNSAARIVNAVVTAYFDLRSQEDAAQTQRVIEILEDESEARAAELKQLRESVRQLTKQASGKDPYLATADSGVVAVQHPLRDLQNQLTTTEVERAVLEARIKAFQEMLAKQQTQVSAAAVERAVAEHQQVQQLQAELAANRAKLREYKEKLVQGEKDPIYRKLQQRIQADENRLAQLRQQLRPEVQAQMEIALVTERKAELARMQSQLETYRLMQQILERRYQSELRNVEELGGETFELELRRRELARAEEVFERIASRILALRTERRAPARVVLMRQAEPPGRPIEWAAYKMIAVGVLGAFLLPFGLAVLWERMVGRVSNAQQLEEQLQLPVVGEVSRLPVRTSLFTASPSKRVGRDVRLFEESIDSLRTYLALSEPLRDARVLAVTSPANNEGKTCVAVQLAVSSARASGELALLIDGDMRSPDIHKVLDTARAPGLAEVLSGQCSVEDAIITTWSSRVHFLPAGKLRGSPHKLVGNGALASLLEKVRGSYRYIIIDTPPVLAASEALVFAKNADASLICTMRDVSRVDQVNATHERLVAANAHPIGIVLNGVPIRQYAYRYGSYYSAEAGQ